MLYYIKFVKGKKVVGLNFYEVNLCCNLRILIAFLRKKNFSYFIYMYIVVVDIYY